MLFDSQYHTPVTTQTGGVTSVPQYDDSENQSVLTSETADSSEVDVNSFQNLELGAFTYRSGYVGVTFELLQDSNWDWPGFMEEVLSLRHARGVGNALVRGSGVNQPTGILTAAVASGCPIVVANGDSTNVGNADTGANSIGSADLASAFGQLNWQYRRNAVWLMNDQSLLQILSIYDKEGRPVVRTFIDDSDGTEQYRIWGRPVAICPSMPSISNAQNPILIYSPQTFFVRTIPAATYVNLVLQGMVGFQSFMRVDCNLMTINAAQPSCCIIQNHS